MSRHGGSAPRGGPFTASPWTRAPLLLLRRPAVFLAVVAATAVLAIAASSGMLFLSTLDTASLRAQAADDCPEASMPFVAGYVNGDHLASENVAGAAAMRRAGALGAPYWVDVVRSQIQATPVALYARSGALAHVSTLTPDRGQAGAWFPDDFAAKLSLHPGSVIRTNTNVPIRVAGIYRNLSPDPFHLANLPRYWCTWKSLILQKLTDFGTPPLLISDVQTVTDVLGPFGSPAVEDGVVNTYSAAVSWYDPIPVTAISASVARAADRHARTAAAAFFGSNHWAGSANGRAYGTGESVSGPPDLLAAKLATAARVRRGLTGSVLPIDLAGALVALLLVAGAGAFWTAHRSREIDLLVSRGVGPTALAAKAVLETLPAALAGLAAGVAASVALVRSVGPAASFAPGAWDHAIIAAGGAVLAGLLLIAAIAAFAGRDRTMGAARSRTRHLPLELVLVALAIWTWLRIRGGNGITVQHNVVHVDPVVLLFPLLGATGVLLLAGRLAAIPIPRLARLTRGIGRAGYLALRRIGGSRAVAIGLLVGTALPCALLAYASTVSRGVHTEIARKYQTNLGAPVVLEMIGIHNVDPQLHGHGTAVAIYPQAATADGGLTVLGLDPATFDAFAFTTAGQRHDVSRLRSARDGSAARAVLIRAGSGASPTSVQLGATRLDVHVIARSDVFPGLRSPSVPMLVVNRAVLADVDTNVDRSNEVWTTPGRLRAVSTLVQREGYSILGELDPQVRIGNTGLLPLTWIFGYLRALAILVGAVAIAALVFALGARTRRRTVSYVMSRRMGLTQGTHLRSLLIELAVVVGSGWLIGTAVGLAGYALLLGSLDLYPALPPGAEFGLPGLALVGTAGAVVVLITIAAVSTHLVAERATPAEILRLE
ncbi:MAG: FtsX-like permease family protein [Jatrophihabitantaceae bacterium]